MTAITTLLHAGIGAMLPQTMSYCRIGLTIKLALKQDSVETQSYSFAVASLMQQRFDTIKPRSELKQSCNT